MNLPDRLIDAADVSAGRFAALFGVYFASGTVFIALATLLGAFPNGPHLSLYLHGGDVFVEDRPGGGAVAVIALPREGPRDGGTLR